MYYSQQSPGITHKLSTHHDHTAWGRATTAAAANHSHSILVPGSQPVGVGVPPLQSPGYPLYTNGALQHHPGHHPLSHAPMHHHQNSLSHYPSPPNGHSHQQQQQQHLIAQGSPAGQIISPHWQQQLLKCDMVRQSRSPHHRARASAMASRTVPKSAIPITNPNSKSITITSPKPEPANGRSSKESPESSSATATNSTPDPTTNSPSTTNHPPANVAPISEAPRPSTAIKPPQNTWGSLDMGGMNIKNLPGSNGLFTFTFLINLYLNHNALTIVPPEVSKLRHLELLDLSGNQLTTLPPELGLLTQLKEFYIFDNHLASLPYELGSLYQLQTLGIEGNPLDASLKNIAQKDGTQALIVYLRDNNPAAPSPPVRQWKNLLTGPEREALAADPNAETVSVLCFNILCERYATERLYGYTPSWALAWSFRRDLIMKEILRHDTDIVCLQEVDIAQYEDYFSKRLADEGYTGVFWPKSRANRLTGAERRQVDGCATFYKSSRFQLIEKQLAEFNALAMARPDFRKTDDMFNRILGKDHIGVICLLEDINTGTRLVVGNAHIHWDPAFSDVKLVQAALLVDEVQKAADRFAKLSPRPPPPVTPGVNDDPDQPISQRPPPVYTEGAKIPVIICGDFNSNPGSGLYEFMSSGNLAPNHPEFLGHAYGVYTSEGLKHRLNLKSAYSAPGAGGEGHVTNFVPGFQGEIDYVWFSAGNLGVNAVLEELDSTYLEKCVGFPNTYFPSDHVAIACEFRVKPPRDQSAKLSTTNPGTPTSL